MDYFRPEIKTGIVILICLILLFIMVFSVGNFKLAKNYNIFRARFNFISGLEKNAPVRFAGTEAGSVKEIKILHDQEKNIEVVLSIDKQAILRTNSEAYINTLGMIGEKYVEVTPGSKDALPLAAGGLIEGIDPTQMDELFKKGDELAEELKITITNLNEILVENREDIREMIANLKVASVEAERFTDLISRQPWRLIWKSTVSYEEGEEEEEEVRKRKKSKKKDTPSTGNKGMIYSR